MGNIGCFVAADTNAGMAEGGLGTSIQASSVVDSDAGLSKDRSGTPGGNTTPLAWPSHTGSSRFDHGFDSGCHDVSVTAVWHLGLGSRTAVLTIRPWWQAGHSLKEEPVSSS
jgi:hypothetical protein